MHAQPQLEQQLVDQVSHVDRLGLSRGLVARRRRRPPEIVRVRHDTEAERPQTPHDRPAYLGPDARRRSEAKGHRHRDVYPAFGAEREVLAVLRAYQQVVIRVLDIPQQQGVVGAEGLGEAFERLVLARGILLELVDVLLVQDHPRLNRRVDHECRRDAHEIVQIGRARYLLDETLPEPPLELLFEEGRVVGVERVLLGAEPCGRRHPIDLDSALDGVQDPVVRPERPPLCQRRP